MVEIPDQQALTPEQAWALLQDWYRLQAELAPLKVREVLLRKQIAGYYFPEPNEGTNRFAIGGGFDLVLKHQVRREIDEAALDTLAKDFRKKKIPLDELVRYSPSLVLREYRKLDEDAMQLFDRVLTIKPAETPSMSIEPAAASDVQVQTVQVQPDPAPETVEIRYGKGGRSKGRNAQAAAVAPPPAPAAKRGRRK